MRHHLQVEHTCAHPSCFDTESDNAGNPVAFEAVARLSASLLVQAGRVRDNKVWVVEQANAALSSWSTLSLRMDCLLAWAEQDRATGILLPPARRISAVSDLPAHRGVAGSAFMIAVLLAWIGVLLIQVGILVTVLAVATILVLGPQVGRIRRRCTRRV